MGRWRQPSAREANVGQSSRRRSSAKRRRTKEGHFPRAREKHFRRFRQLLVWRRSPAHWHILLPLAAAPSTFQMPPGTAGKHRYPETLKICEFSEIRCFSFFWKGGAPPDPQSVMIHENSESLHNKHYLKSAEIPAQFRQRFIAFIKM